MGVQLLPVYGLPAPEKVADQRLEREHSREVEYDQEELTIRTENLQDNLTNDQLQVYNAFLEILEKGNDLDDDNKNIMFLDAPGGTGKTYLINLVLSKIRSQSKILLATASNGIATTRAPSCKAEGHSIAPSKYHWTHIKWTNPSAASLAIHPWPKLSVTQLPSSWTRHP